MRRAMRKLNMIQDNFKSTEDGEPIGKKLILLTKKGSDSKGVTLGGMS
jgi:hypothetical protein